MATKVIYFIISGKHERAEFRSDDPAEDVRGKTQVNYVISVCYC